MAWLLAWLLAMRATTVPALTRVCYPFPALLFLGMQRIGFQWLSALLFAAAATGYYKRLRWAPIKMRKITY